MATYSEIEQELMEDLRGVNRFNPNNIPKLERFVHMQLVSKQFDRDANLTLLKLYQLNRDKWRADTVGKVLALAAMALPRSDFVLAKCLIDSDRPDDTPERKAAFDTYVRPALYLGDLLESCQFPQAWAFIRGDTVATESEDEIEYDGPPIAPLLEGVAGFREAVQKFVCHTVSITFQTIKKDLLKELLGNVSETELNETCAAHKWTIENDGYIFVSNHEATVKSRNIEEKIDIAHFGGLLVCAAAMFPFPLQIFETCYVPRVDIFPDPDFHVNV